MEQQQAVVQKNKSLNRIRCRRHSAKLTPEQKAARNARERDRQRQKRANPDYKMEERNRKKQNRIARKKTSENLRDSNNPVVVAYAVYNRGEEVKIENSPEFHSRVEDNRVRHEGNHPPSDKTIADGKLKIIGQYKKKDTSPPKPLVSRKENPKEWNERYGIKKVNAWLAEIMRIVSINEAMIKAGIVATRNNWTRYCRDTFQKCCAAIMSRTCNDEQLESTIMALRKLDMLELDYLASASNDVLRKVENVLLISGYNLYTTAAPDIMSFAWHVKHTHRGKVPTDQAKLAKLDGIGRKVMALMLQDAFQGNDADDILYGKRELLVSDRHVAAVATALGWTTVKLAGKPNEDADKIATDMESWLPKNLYKKLNESIGGLRQLWKDSSNVDKMKEVAKSMRETDLLMRVVEASPAVVPQNKKSKKMRVPHAAARAAEAWIGGIVEEI